MTEDKIKRGYGGGMQAIDFSDLSRQIEEAKKKSKLLQGSAIGLVVVSLLIGYLLFNYFVLRYAVIEDLQMTQDASRPTWVYFAFLVKEGGVVKRGYERAVSEDIVSANNSPKLRSEITAIERRIHANRFFLQKHVLRFCSYLTFPP